MSFLTILSRFATVLLLLVTLAPILREIVGPDPVDRYVAAQAATRAPGGG